MVANDREACLIELMRIICGFSLTQDHKNSLEKDLSLELKAEEALEESDEHDSEVLLVVQVKEEMEEVELGGERGQGEILFERRIFGVLGGCCEITSLS